MSLSDKEAVGVKFSAEVMLRAQALTWKAAERIVEMMHPGMRESEALSEAKCCLSLPKQ